jgi:hypothetical protein
VQAAELEALVPASGPERDAWTAGCARGFLLDGENADCPAALALIAKPASHPLFVFLRRGM